MLGLTQKKPEPPTNNDAVFQSPRPQYTLSDDAQRLGHTTPPIKDSTPASPVIQGILRAVQGNDKLAELILAAEKKAKEAARNQKPSQRKSKQAETISGNKPNTTTQVLFSDADKCQDDQEFIKRTRSNPDFFSIEMRRLFFANGGQAYLDRGLLYGQAFDMMRREKLAALKKLVIDSSEPLWKRCDSLSPDTRVYVAGLPTDDLRMRRALAKDLAFERKSNEAWMRN